MHLLKKDTGYMKAKSRLYKKLTQKEELWSNQKEKATYITPADNIQAYAICTVQAV